MTTLKLPLCTGVVLASFVGLADGVVNWAATGTSAACQWGTASNWVLENGLAPELAPTNGEDVVMTPLVYANSTTPDGITVKTGEASGSGSGIYLSAPSVNPTITSLAGSHAYLITHTDWKDYQVQQERRFTVSNPDSFKGFFAAGDARAILSLAATPSHVPAFPNVSGLSRLAVEVPTAGTAASVESIYEHGVLEKTGAGSLTVKGTPGAKTDIVVTLGQLVLGGADAASSIDGLKARAAVHFDASDGGSLQKYHADGRTYVWRLDDVRGEDVYYAATNNFRGENASRVAYCQAPFISPATSPTGLPLLDFGTPNDAGTTELGPTNCFLQFKNHLTTVREAFYVVETPLSSQNVNVLGSVYENNYDFKGAVQQLFYTKNNSCTNVWGGDIAINGERKLNSTIDPRQLFDLYTVSVGTLDNACVSAIGAERLYSSGTGGFRLGEMLLFTNVLTRAERMRINAYLNAKWRTGETLREAGAVSMNGASTTVGVPSGATAHVRAVVAPNGLAKTGAGTLKVDHLSPDGASVTLAGGLIDFGSIDSGNTLRPATNAYLWLDANAPDVFTLSAGSVQTWKDCRTDVQLSAACPLSVLPTVASHAGKTVVDFGPYRADSSSYMRLPTWGNANVYAGFIVLRQNSVANQDIFGSSDMQMYRHGNDTDKLLSTAYRHPAPLGIHWAVDGEAVDPIALTSAVQAKLAATNEFHVYSFSGSHMVKVDAIATDRGTYNGGLAVAEMILYSRPITDKERVSTEAYLLDKWLGVAHPEKCPSQVGTISYAGEEDFSMEVDGGVRVQKLAGGTGKLVKSGVGSLELVTAGDVQSIEVKDGTLSISGRPDFIEDAAAFHFDSSDMESFTTYLATDYAGTIVTNISRWQDTRRNGVYAYPAMRFDNVDTTNIVAAPPTLAVAEYAAGRKLPAVDFGDVRNSSDTALLTSSASLTLSTPFTNIREIYGVLSDAHGANSAIFWGDTSRATYDYYRGAKGTLFGSAANAFVREGDIRLDGVGGTEFTAAFPSGFHLLGVAQTGTTTVKAFARDRVYRVGGCSMGETIAFNRNLTAGERTILESYLLGKWFGTAGACYTNVYDNISVEAGSTLLVDNVNAVVKAKFKGAGTIKASGVVIEELSVDGSDAASWPHLSIDGSVVFAEGARISIDVETPSMVKPGSYHVLEASGFNSMSSVVLDTPLKSNRSVRLRVDGNALYLDVRPKGICISFY